MRYAIKYLAENDRERFEQIVTEKMKSLGLDYDDALSEVIADGCELMLRDTNAPALLARENPSLLQKICDWIGELTEKLRAAFEGVGARHEEARILMKEAQELQKRFDAVLAEAVQNRENARSNQTEDSKNAAPKGGKEQYSIKNTRGLTWEKQTASYLTGKLKSSDSLYLGNSSKYVRGVSSSPLYIPTSIVTKAMRPQKGSRSAHAMTENDIRGLEKGIREASAVIYNPDRNALIYIAQEAEKGGQIVATFDLNNNLFGENAHKGTSIHPRESIIPMLEKLGEDAVIYVKNENKFNELAGLQSDNPPKLLANVELVNKR